MQELEVGFVKCTAQQFIEQSCERGSGLVRWRNSRQNQVGEAKRERARRLIVAGSWRTSARYRRAIERGSTPLPQGLPWIPVAAGHAQLTPTVQRDVQLIDCGR